MNEPRWVNANAVLLLHSASLAAHGGRAGIRDRAGLDSALARPRNRFAYEREADIARLAAAYGFGLTRNHPFEDGNKRISFHVVGLFVQLNGYRLSVEDPVDAIKRVVDLASGQLSEESFADWIRSHLKKNA